MASDPGATVPSLNHTSTVSELLPINLRQRLASGETLTLLDVREPRERALCSIKVPPTANDLHIPMREVPAQLESVQGALRRGALVVYCHHGVRSRAVAEWLAERGFAGIVNLTGGIDAWSKEADSTVPRYR